MIKALLLLFSILNILSIAHANSQSDASGSFNIGSPSVGGSIACNDGVDNDGDGLIDYGVTWNDGTHDPGCVSLADTEESVGVPVGVTLSTGCANPITSSGTYDACQWNSGLTINANNVTITRSLIKGEIGGSYTGSTLTIEDSDLDFNFVSTATTFDNRLYTCTRCEVYNGGVFSTGYGSQGGMTVSQSLVYDLWSRNVGGADPCTHEEDLQDSGPGTLTVTWTRFVGNYDAATECTAMSAIIALYSHGLWENTANKSFDNSRFENRAGPAHCFYMGSACGEWDATGMTFTNNTIYGCGTASAIDMVGWQNTGTWSNNTLDDGTQITEPDGCY